MRYERERDAREREMREGLDDVRYDVVFHGNDDDCIIA